MCHRHIHGEVKSLNFQRLSTEIANGKNSLRSCFDQRVLQKRQGSIEIPCLLTQSPIPSSQMNGVKAFFFIYQGYTSAFTLGQLPKSDQHYSPLLWLKCVEAKKLLLL